MASDCVIDDCNERPMRLRPMIIDASSPSAGAGQPPCGASGALRSSRSFPPDASKQNSHLARVGLRSGGPPGILQLDVPSSVRRLRKRHDYALRCIRALEGMAKPLDTVDRNGHHLTSMRRLCLYDEVGCMTLRGHDELAAWSQSPPHTRERPLRIRPFDGAESADVGIQIERRAANVETRFTLPV